MDTSNNRVIEIAYDLYTVGEDGEHLVERATEDKPYRFISGFGLTLETLEEAVVGLEQDSPFDVKLTKEQAYGDYEEERVLDLDREIFSINGHFDIDSLYNQMKDNKYRFSRATLYNTIDLLLDCGLVIKHQFGHNCAQYERSYKFRQHDHFIDLETENVMEFCDPRLLEIQRSIEEQLGVEITHHSLIFYGHKKR